MSSGSSRGGASLPSAAFAIMAIRPAISLAATLRIDVTPCAAVIGALEELACADTGIHHARRRDDERGDGSAGRLRTRPQLTTIRAHKKRVCGCRIDPLGVLRIVGHRADWLPETAGIAPAAKAIHRPAHTPRGRSE